MRFVVPREQEAGERVWALVRTAYAECEPVAWPRRHALPLVAGAVVAAIAAAALSPPGRSVVRSLCKAVGVERAEPALFSLPTPGRLLVASRSGAWLVRPDGSKRRLGAYRDAAFSPHALFVAGTRPSQLVALDLEGHVRWTLARREPRLPAWTGTRTDTRIAYLSGGLLRVVAGDGTGDRAVARASLVRPAWRPGPGRVLAYSAGRSAVVYDLDADRVVFRTPPVLEPVRKLAWSRDGRALLVFAPHATRAYLGSEVIRQDDPSDATSDQDAAFVGATHDVAAIRVAGVSSNVFSLAGGRTFFAGTGAFRQLAWSPDGRWARHLADGEPVGLRPYRGETAYRRGIANLGPVRRLPPGRGVVLRGLIVALLAAAGLAAAAPAARDTRVVVGHSVRGRAIVAYERGDPAAPVTLVVGVIHGTEPAGLAVVSRLRRMPLPAGVHLWLVPTVNPDGLAAGTRQNAHGVDLNRNWPTAWVHNGRPWDGYYSGPRPFSEPESRAMQAFVLRVRPALTIWYHQPLDVVYGSDPHVAVLRRYARLSGLPYRRLTAPPGAVTRWQRRRFPRSPAFVVEFPGGRITPATVRRNAAAVLSLAKGLPAPSSP